MKPPRIVTGDLVLRDSVLAVRVLVADRGMT